jgi:hypothetical protein
MIEIIKSKSFAIVVIILIWCKKSNGMVKMVLLSLDNCTGSQGCINSLGNFGQVI